MAGYSAACTAYRTNVHSCMITNFLDPILDPSSLWIDFAEGIGTKSGELPQSVRAEISREIGSDVSVAFLYSRFHIFYATVGTWNGRSVLSHGEEYWEAPASGWHGLIGALPESDPCYGPATDLLAAFQEKRRYERWY